VQPVMPPARSWRPSGGVPVRHRPARGDRAPPQPLGLRARSPRRQSPRAAQLTGLVLPKPQVSVRIQVRVPPY